MCSTYIEELNKLNEDIIIKQQKIKQINNIITKNDLIYQKNIEEKQKKTDRIMSIIGTMLLRRDDHLINHDVTITVFSSNHIHLMISL